MIDAVAQIFRRVPSGGKHRALSLQRPSPRLTIALLGVLVLPAGTWLAVRDSSLVAVNRVSVSGAGGPDAARVRAALVLAARNMTTLDVQQDQLQSAVAPFPVVKALSVSTQFPHGMRIHVIEQTPVGAAVVGGRRIAVAGDGTLLHDVAAGLSLPIIPLRVPPGGSRLTDRQALGAVAVLAAGPYGLLQRVSQIQTIAQHGLVAQLRNGPSIYFGDATMLNAKWTAASEVLADPGSAGSLYVDVTDPQRPAAGGVAAGAAAGGVSAAGGIASGPVSTGAGPVAGTGAATGPPAPGASGTATSTAPVSASSGTAASGTASASGADSAPAGAAPGG